MARQSSGHRVGILAKEDPPPKAARGSILDELLKLVPQLRGERGTWFRIAEFVSPSGAANAGKRLKERYPDQIETAHTREDPGSVLHARWTGNRTNGVDR